jgi:predicted Ser/Thr protein kinase
MIRCVTCSSEVADSVSKCPQCGSAVKVASVSMTATVATSFSAAPPESELEDPPIAPALSYSASSSTSRISSISIVEDEGRFTPGTMIGGRYRILGMLGKGGMGEVYRATDLTLAQSVALKFLLKEAASNQRWLERFHTEVRIARQISHPNVCRVYDIGEADGTPFISMEFIDGDDIATLLVGIGRLPADKAVEIARKICAGLAAAHDRGVIHRDLKPQNIMMTKRGEILITDFGLAAVADRLGGPEARNGTPAYMSPEQLRGAEVTPRSDIYALGLVLYELFTGKKPYEAKTIPELLSLQESQQLSSMSSVANDIDPAVEGIIKRCLHPDPGMRPASALAVAAALPGGDPLAAALAAGETPSPELLASCGKREAVPLKWTLPAMVLVLIALIAAPFFVHKTYFPAYSPLNMSPEVLEQKARDHAATLGYPDRGNDWMSALRDQGGYMGWINQHRHKGTDWSALLHAEPTLYLFYRQSPRPLVSRPDGTVTDNRPAQTISGMWRMEVDSRGLLRRFDAVPPQLENAPASVAPMAFDPGPAFRAAGFDLSKFTETTPRWTPQQAFDARRAWTGVHPQIADLPITVEIAAWRGRVVDFQIIWPWTKPTRMEPLKPEARQLIGTAIGTICGAAGLFFCIWLARRNLRLGRGDQRGAWRLAIAYFVLRLLAVPAEVHFVPEPSNADILLYNLGFLAFSSGLLWLLYVALEPAVRARWPHSIVTWSRAISGQFSDPQLGAHILWGVGIGILVTAVFGAVAYYSLQVGERPQYMNLYPAVNTRTWIASVTGNAASALTVGMTLIFLIFGVRFIVRKDWIAAVVVGLLMAIRNTAQNDGDLAFVLGMMLVIYAGLIFALMRVGMVAAAVGVFVTNMLLQTAATLDPQAWYALPSYLRLVLIAALAWFGFVKSRGDSTTETEAV